MKSSKRILLATLGLGIVLGILVSQWFARAVTAVERGKARVIAGSQPKAAAVPQSATAVTKKANANVRKQLPFANKQDFKDAMRGFIAPLPNNGVIKNAAGRVVWDLSEWDFLKGKAAPDTVNPSLWRQAQLLRIGGLFKVVDGIYQVRSADITNISFIEGPDGITVMDPLLCTETAKVALELYYKHRPKKPIVAVIHTHSHIDHYGGVKSIVSEEDVAAGKVKIIAPAGYTEASLSEGVIGGNRQTRLSGYQYGALVKKGPKGPVTSGLGLTTSSGTVTFLRPTDIITNTGQKLKLGGLTFEFMLAPDTEAPAELFYYTPALKALCTGEDAVRNMHNVYSLRGAKLRSAYNWAKYLKEARLRWGDEAEVLYAPHHWPVWGNKAINEYLEKQAAMYKYINDQTVRLANSGYSMTQAAEMIKLPDSLASEWYLRGYYGTVNHNVKAAYVKHFGWFDGNPAVLHRLPEPEAAKLYVEFMGGAKSVLKKARKYYEMGNYRWVAEVVNHVVFADPKNQEARNLLANTLEQMGYQAEAGTWRGWFLSAAKELREGISRPRVLSFASADTISAMPLDTFFDYLGIRLNGPKAEGKKITLNFDMTDTKKKYLVTVNHSVLDYVSGKQSKNADATITMKRATLNNIILGKTNLIKAITAGDVRIKGNRKALQEFLSLLDSFDPWYNLVTPVAQVGKK